MKVLVLGAGVVGTTAAWYLAKAGHEVAVIERHSAAAMETSFANGGQVSPCHAEPWANPGTPFKALKWLGHEDAPLIFRLTRYDPALWLWLMQFLRNCTAGRARINTERTLRVAIYSRVCLQELRAETGIQYDQQMRGILHVYRNPREFEHATHAAEMMASFGLDRKVKSVTEAVEIEPALTAVSPELAGAIYTQGDESGDAHIFTQKLATLAADNGVVFHYDTAVEGFAVEGGRIVSVQTNHGTFGADVYVMALGSWSPKFSRQLGFALPVYPAKGYSATLPVTDPTAAPVVSITDDEHKMVFSRLGDRLRCAGTAELAGWDDHLTDVRAHAIVRHARSLFPGAGDFDTAELWAGLRPTTPDSVPIIGVSPVENLYLDTGHGTLGWTMSCGSARLLADIISGHKPDISPDGLGWRHYV